MIFVESEFAPLRKVVLAQSEFGYPKVLRPEDLRFLEEPAVSENMENRGMDYVEEVRLYPRGFASVVEYIDFSVSRSFGGAFRCSTQALLRK